MTAKKDWHAALVLRAFAYVFVIVKFCLRLQGFCRKSSQVLRKVKVDGSRCENFDLGSLVMPTEARPRGISVVAVVRV